MIMNGNHPLSGKIDFDSAFASGWDFYKRWFLPMYAISVLMALITSIFTSRIDISSLQYMDNLQEMAGTLKGMMGTYLLIMLISLLLNTLLHYYVIFRPVSEHFSLGEAFVKVVTRFYLPLLLVYIVFGILSFVAMFFGILLLFIGLLFAIPYVMIFFMLITPVMIIEDTSPGETISRVFRLAHNQFWPNMGIVTVFLLIIIFFSFIISTLVMLPFSGTMMKSIFDPDYATKVLEISRNPAFILLSSLASGLTTPLPAIFGVILYFRNAENSRREGIDQFSGGGSPKTDDLYPQKDEFRPTVDDLRP